MKINEILSLSCDFLGLKELKSQIGQESEGIDKDKLSAMLKCLNLAYQEIVTEYLPELETQVMTVKGGKISFSDFPRQISGVVSVKDLDGHKIPFTFSAGAILVGKERQVCVTYQIMPDELNFGDEVKNTFPDRLIAYGTVREYLFMEGMSDEALKFDKRFKDTLFNFIRKKSLSMLPRRKWII